MLLRVLSILLLLSRIMLRMHLIDTYSMHRSIIVIICPSTSIHPHNILRLVPDKLHLFSLMGRVEEGANSSDMLHKKLDDGRLAFLLIKEQVTSGNILIKRSQ